MKPKRERVYIVGFDKDQFPKGFDFKKNPRKLTPKECAKLQGFPEDFIIPVSDSQAYK